MTLARNPSTHIDDRDSRFEERLCVQEIPPRFLARRPLLHRKRPLVLVVNTCGISLERVLHRRIDNSADLIAPCPEIGEYCRESESSAEGAKVGTCAPVASDRRRDDSYCQQDEGYRRQHAVHFRALIREVREEQVEVVHGERGLLIRTA